MQISIGEQFGGIMRRSVLIATVALSSLVASPVLLADGPVVADVRDGPCHMVISGQFAIFSVHVEGLVPGESMLFESISNGERIARETRAASDGTWGSAVMVQVLGSETGTDTITIRASRCTLTATFPWSVDE